MKTIMTLLLLISTLCSKSFEEKVGDFMQYALPLTAYGTTLYLDDTEGQKAFYKSYATTMATTYALKYTVKEKRPQSEATDSFPSGHTASAFGGASFIHFRYGLSYAVIPYYLAAVFTGYSRVKAEKHYTVDVVAAGLIAITSSAYFVEKYEKIQFSLLLKEEARGVLITYKW